MSARVVTAGRLHEHGQPLRVEQVELAEPGADEVLVELQHAGFNPVDTYIARGLVAAGAPLPRTLGGEATGTLEGCAVLVAGAGLGSARDGLWATAAVVPRAAVLLLPDGVDPVEAASAGVAGLTAQATVEELAQVTAADRVLVLGAAGGVGLPVVSLAVSAGAIVRGQTSSRSKAQAIAALGAQPVVSAADGLADALAGWQPTVVIDPLGGAFTPAAVTALAPGGRLVSFGTSAGAEVTLPMQALYRKGLRVLGYGGVTVPEGRRREGLAAVLDALAAGRMRIPVARRIPLTEVSSAFDALRDRTLAGNLVIDLGTPGATP